VCAHFQRNLVNQSNPWHLSAPCGNFWQEWWKMVEMVENGGNGGKKLGDPFPRFHQFDRAGNLS
jgi:hypothetical protein